MRVYRSFPPVAPTGLGFRSSWDVLSVSDDNTPDCGSSFSISRFLLGLRFISPFLPLPSRLRLIVPKETSFSASYPMNADAHDSALKIIFPRIRELGTTEEILGEAKIEGSTAR